jgi:hypothetical protein
MRGICATNYGNFDGQLYCLNTTKLPPPSETLSIKLPIDGFHYFPLRQLFNNLHTVYKPVICTTHYENCVGNFIVAVTTKLPSPSETLLIDGFHRFLLRKLKTCFSFHYVAAFTSYIAPEVFAHFSHSIKWCNL